MASFDVVLVASLFNVVKISENLGIGSLAAVLRERGRSVKVIDPSVEGLSPTETAKRIMEVDSPVLGISVLRDEQKADILEMVEALRAVGDERFIVIGGHAPTIAIATGEEDYPPPMEGVALEADTTVPWGPGGEWESLPWGTRRVSYRDLAVHCEAFLLGEADLSLPELVDCVIEGKPWRNVPGLAYRRESQGLMFQDGNPDFVLNDPAEKPTDLDALPFMARDVLDAYIENYPGKVAASICLGRGCMYRCTFCTVAVFQGLQDGGRHRQRSPEDVVAEIDLLHQQYGITTFNFEDDNFIVRNKPGIAKVHELCRQIKELDYDIEFSIFCRPDAVRKELFADLRDAGMNIVYLGLESVHEGDLDFFHKGVKISQIHESLDTLIDLGYSLEVNDGRRVKIGFIAWHPLTTLASLKDAVAFVRKYRLPPKILRRKLLLYSGIPIKQQIRDLGLLAPDTVNGWNYQVSWLEPLERAVESYIQLTVSRPYRDRIRTVTKAIDKYVTDTETPAELVAHQQEMDEMCLRFVEELLDEAEKWSGDDVEKRTAMFSRRKQREFEAYIHDHDIETQIEAGFALAGLPTVAADPFRQ